MTTDEFFPPTEAELKEIISTLKKQLEDDRYQEDWIKIHDELMYRQKQLQKLTQNKSENERSN